MTNTETRQLHQELFAEYRRSAVRKRYIGDHATLKAQEGFAWLSTAAYGRWCFIPLRTTFTVDNVTVVKGEHLVNS